MSAPRGHHLVAQVYQRGLARQRRKTWQVRLLDRATGADRVSSVGDTFKRRDWNTVVDADGTRDFAVEGILANLVDGPVAPALEQMRNGDFLAEHHDRLTVAMFISAQLVRGRRVRENLSRFVVEVERRRQALTAQHYTDEHWLRAIGEVPETVRASVCEAVATG